MLASFIFWILQQFDFGKSSSFGLPIPDIVNISHTFDNLLSTGGLDQEENQFFGLTLLYGWTWLLHPALCFGVNSILMILATKIYDNFFIKRLCLPAWSILGVIGNPYLALAMIGPNKEIPLLLLTLIFLKSIIEQRSMWLLTAAATSIAAFTLREGYGLFLAITLPLIIAKINGKTLAAIIFLACALISISFGFLDSIFPTIFGRNKDVFEMLDGGVLAVGAFSNLLDLDPLTATGGGTLFIIRAIYNILTMALFPVFKTTAGIHWLGVAYWLFGLMILVCITACIASLMTKKPLHSSVLLAAALSVGTWLMISVSLFVQPRYLMPVFPVATYVLACSSPRTRIISLLVPILLTAIVILTYILLDRAPPLAEPDSFNTPAYIL